MLASITATSGSDISATASANSSTVSAEIDTTTGVSKPV